MPNTEITEQIENWSINTFNVHEETEDRLSADDFFGRCCIHSLTGSQWLDKKEEVNQEYKDDMLKCWASTFDEKQMKILRDYTDKWIKYKWPVIPVHVNNGNIYLYDCTTI